MKSSKGIFITFEGGEGAGKTTLIESFTAALMDLEINVVTTREPGGTQFGETLRQWLLSSAFSENVNPKTELLLFLAARAQHIQEVIQPAIVQGKVVLCDRYNDSTIAYQGGGRGLDIEYVQHLCASVCQGVEPDLTFLLDVDVDKGLDRAKWAVKDTSGAGECDRIESENELFHKSVLQTFRMLAEKNPKRIYIVDAQESKREVFQYAFNIFSGLFLKDKL